MYIGLDFDGTVVKHQYPLIGEDVPQALYYLRRFVDKGANIILFTMRDGDTLKDAVSYLESHYIELYGINRNPTQGSWTESPKAYAHVYIDDAAYGCPLIYPEVGRPFVDWNIVGPGILKLLQGDLDE